MFSLFRKRADNGKNPPLPELYDLNDKQLLEGDKVVSLRYEMGRSELIVENGQYYYQSLETGKKVIWLKMVDAITEKQKVKKLQDEEGVL